MTDNSNPGLEPCAECSLVQGAAIEPTPYLEPGEEDPESGFYVMCMNCDVQAYGPTPEAARQNWNSKQRGVLGHARAYLASLPADPDPDPAPSGP